MSSFSSQPPTESIVTILESEGFDTGLDQKKLAEINAYFQELKKIRQPASSAKVEPVDAGVLVHAIPGGMISNLRSQLAQQGALDRLPEVLKTADIVLSAVDASRPVVTQEMCAAVADRNVLFVDLGVPRNIDPFYDDWGHGVNVADLDDLKLWHRVKTGTLNEVLAKADDVIRGEYRAML